MDNLLFSLQSVLPLFVLILCGYGMRRAGLIHDGFVEEGTKVVFQLTLPITLFRQIATTDLSSVFNPSLMLFCVLSVLVTIAAISLLLPLFVKDKASLGAMIQGSFRGNFAIIGIPLAIRILGEDGAKPAALILPFIVPIYNIASVIILTLLREPAENESSARKIPLWPILKGILTNPLIIGIVLGLIPALLHVQIPAIIDDSLAQIGNLTTPLALICLGGEFTMRSAKEKLPLTIWATLLKLVLFPLLIVGTAIAFGFRGSQLGAIFVLFSAPTAVASFVMARNMRSDHVLAGQILVFTTVFSSFTIFLGTFLLRTFSLI